MNLRYSWQPTYNWQKLVKKKRFHVSYLCTFALRFLSHIYYYRQSQFTLKSLAILLCDLPSDHGVVWACGLAEEEWVDSGDAVGSCAPCCYPESWGCVVLSVAWPGVARRWRNISWLCLIDFTIGKAEISCELSLYFCSKIPFSQLLLPPEPIHTKISGNSSLWSPFWPWCGRVGWPRKSGWIAGTPLGLVPLAAAWGCVVLSVAWPGVVRRWRNISWLCLSDFTIG